MIIIYVKIFQSVLLTAVLQRHYRHLEAIALEKDSVEEVQDLTKSDENRIRTRLGTLLDNFKDLTSPFSEGDTSGKKRKVLTCNNYV